jgi:hypothetical protein
MRSFLLIICTVAVITGGFFVYNAMLGSGGTSQAQHTLAPPSLAERPGPTSQSLRGLGVGDSVWVKRYDPKTGELASQFKGDKYIPQPDGVTVHVERPQAEFFTNDGSQRLRIEGASGDVVMNLPPSDQKGQMVDASPAQAPDRGKLRDVRLSIYQPADAAEPVLVARMNNASFDNDTFRIATDAYTDATGHQIEADQVPVVVRGRDYDFDGRGLVVRWNERDRRLQLLEIAHGEKLVLKHPHMLSQPGGSGISEHKAHSNSAIAKAPAPRPVREVMKIAHGAVVIPVAAKSHGKPTRAQRARKRQAASSEPSAPARIARDHSPVIYRATFETDVRIFQGRQQLASGETMHIDLLQAPARDSTTQPANEESESDGSSDASWNSRSQPTSRPVKGSSRPVGHSEAALATSRRGNNHPAQTQPAEEPIIVKWTGKLRVLPLASAPDEELVPGKPTVRLIGAPVLLTREQSEVRCGSVLYNSADGTGSLRSSDRVPEVTMIDGAGTRITTPRIDYAEISPTERIATLTGSSRAEFPSQSGDGRVQNVIATWTKDCHLYLAQSAATGDGDKDQSAEDQMKSGLAIERAELAGDVKVDHPNLKLSSDQLTLGFERATAATTAPGTQPVAGALTTRPAVVAGKSDSAQSQIHEIIAKGQVHCRMIEPQQAPRTIDTQLLRVEMAHPARGAAYAKLLRADGDVVASQAKQVLRARHLVAQLAPREPGSTSRSSSAGESTEVRLVSLLASDEVKLTTGAGAGATADRLTATAGPDGRQIYHLFGAPNATVSNGQTVIAGRTIDYDPVRQLASVPGAGTIHAVEPSDPKQSADIAWQGGATVDGNTNWIDVTDRVVVTAKQSDGTINHATSDRLRARLGPKATSQPSATTLAATLPATLPTARGKGTTTRPDDDAAMNFLAGKDIHQVTLIGHVEVHSELAGKGGQLARGVHLLAETLTYDRVSGRMVVPVPGEMLYEDHRAPASQPAEDSSLGGARGATAFAWQKSLVYDEPAMRATMTGDVHIVHKPDASSGQSFDVRGGVLDAFLERDPNASTRPSTRASTRASTLRVATTSPADESSAHVRLKRVDIRDNVHVISPRLDLDATALSYDPISQLLTARGGERNPLIVFDKATGAKQTASELIWNTQTDQFRIVDLAGRMQK